MCRHQLPVWQELYAAHQSEGFEILSISVDALGPSVVKHWTQRANAGFATVVDQENLLAGEFGFKAVPNGLLVDPNGILRLKQFGGFDIRKAENRAQVESFIGQAFATLDAGPIESIQTAPSKTGESWETYFQAGVRWLESGNQREAALELRKALLLDPANFLVRKQLWRTLHPDKFGEQIDQQWQKEQIEREAQLGYEQANPVE